MKEDEGGRRKRIEREEKKEEADEKGRIKRGI